MVDGLAYDGECSPATTHKRESTRAGRTQGAAARSITATVDGVKVGFIGMTLEDTPVLVATASATSGSTVCR